MVIIVHPSCTRTEIIPVHLLTFSMKTESFPRKQGTWQIGSRSLRLCSCKESHPFPGRLDTPVPLTAILRLLSTFISLCCSSPLVLARWKETGPPINNRFPVHCAAFFTGIFAVVSRASGDRHCNHDTGERSEDTSLESAWNSPGCPQAPPALGDAAAQGSSGVQLLTSLNLFTWTEANMVSVSLVIKVVYLSPFLPVVSPWSVWKGQRSSLRG